MTPPSDLDLTNHEPRVSVVLPAHNEVRILGATVTKLATGLAERSITHEIVIVENGSTDGSLRLARLLSLQLSNVRVLALPRGNYGSALRAGFEAARGEFVINFDVDYYNLQFIDTAMRLLQQGSDLVLASKRAEGAHDGRPLLRRALTAGFSQTLKAILHLEVTDAHGMKAMRRGAFAPIVDKCVMTGSVFDVEMVLRAIKAGRTFSEVPAEVVELRPPRTSIWYRSIEALIGVIRLRWILRDQLRPQSRSARR